MFADAYLKGQQMADNSSNALWQGFERGHRMGSMIRERNALSDVAGKMSSRDYEGAAKALFGIGKFDAGLAVSRYGQDAADRESKRKVGSAFAGKFDDDPDSPAALAATGGDLDMAMKLLDWSRNTTKEERELARQKANDFAAVVTPIAARKYEERKPLIMAQAKLLQDFGYTPEQIESFDPTDDNIRAQQSAALGLQKVLGGYSQREVGDNLVTYNETPFGVRRVGSEAIPETREEVERRRHNREMERVGAYRADAYATNAAQPSSSDIMAGIKLKVRDGLPLTRGEQKLYDDSTRAQDPLAMYLSGGPGGADYTDPVPPGTRLPPEPASAPNALAPRAPAPPQAVAPRMAGGNASTPPTHPPARPGMAPKATAPRVVAPRKGDSAANPARPRNDAEFERLPVGAYFVNPSDGRVLQKAR